ncbi:MAG: hypothetical protein CMO82_05190 [Winogradskyella sp.]|nr:hypothetical protein [Winogradskyella sp.]|tara:strand:- start:342 stop:542 length:201 start_codon:yes stop_codon:yes gene_type:complete
MALIFVSHTKCAICSKVLEEQDNIFGLPPLNKVDHRLYEFFDRGFHQECFDNWVERDEILEILNEG